MVIMNNQLHLFKGIDKNNNWVEGSLIQTENNAFICPKNEDTIKMITVDYFSVCRFANVYYSNQQKAYDYDIASLKNDDGIFYYVLCFIKEIGHKWLCVDEDLTEFLTTGTIQNTDVFDLSDTWRLNHKGNIKSDNISNFKNQYFTK